MLDLSLPIEKLKNVGTRNAPRLHYLGIKTVRNLLWHLPTRYENYSETVPIADIKLGTKINIQGEVVKISTKKLFSRSRQGFGGQARRMFITDAIIKDLTGAIRAVWFNQPFIENQLPEGVFVSLAGKVKAGKNGIYLASPTHEKISPFQPSAVGYQPSAYLKHTKGLVPIYPETEGITSKYLRFLIKPLLSDFWLKDPIPKTVLKKYGLPTLSEAIKSAHFPKSEEAAKLAKERLAFDNLILFQMKALLERRKINQLKSTSVKFDNELIKTFITKLPFELTRDQKIAAWEILKDLEKSYPMNRLLEGDVGSGKTVVALIAALEVAASGYQSVFLAPTEILAHQHFRTISNLLSNTSIKVGLLTGSTAQISTENIIKKELKKKILDNEVKIVIGTHAVIQKDVEFKNLAFVIIDEQHRFGVSQRAHLMKNSDLIPHLLSMTATPIPRTLALTIYGDLDISIIREKPKNRQKIITKIIDQHQRNDACQFVREEVKKGRQVFVVCPRIESTRLDTSKQLSAVSYQPASKNMKQLKMSAIWAEVKAVEEEYRKLSQEIFPDLKVAMLHGKMKPKEKQEIMSGFKDRKCDILVSTSVIEVGVDIPNVTIMMIESAERFGLAQLHQFRGRVGRDEYQSYCLLFSSTEDRSVSQRLKALVDCDDGFKLAEKDMAIRGPGEFMGTKQSGIPDLAMASLANVDLIKKARFEARLLLKEDSSLTHYPLLQERLTEFQKMTHFE